MKHEFTSILPLLLAFSACAVDSDAAGAAVAPNGTDATDDGPTDAPLIPTPKQASTAPSGVSQGSNSELTWPATIEEAARGAAYIVSGTITAIGAAQEVTQEKWVDDVWVVVHRETASFQPDGAIALTWNTTGTWGGVTSATAISAITFWGGVVQLIDDEGLPSDVYGDAIGGAGEPPPHFSVGQRVVAFLTMQASPSPALTDDWRVTYRIRTLVAFDGVHALLPDGTSVDAAALTASVESALEKSREVFLDSEEEAAAPDGEL